MDLAGLIVGLGNPGAAYADTRHNFGFHVVDILAALAEAACPSRLERVKTVKKQYDLMRIRFNGVGGAWMMAKPLTFMNLSGAPVAQICHYYKIASAQVLVVHDELDLSLGRMKLKFGGGTAGHNGLKSIAACLGGLDFYRLRLGIGKPVAGDIVSYVLTRFSKDEISTAAMVAKAAALALADFAADGPAATQRINSFKVQAAPPEA